MLERYRLSRGSVELQTGQSHATTGMPWLEPVPNNSAVAVIVSFFIQESRETSQL